MKKEFVNYEEALALKKLGFDDSCVAIYSQNNPHFKDGEFHLRHPHPFTVDQFEEIKQDVREYHAYISAPLYQQAFKWFRENYSILENYIKIEVIGSDEYLYDYQISYIPKENVDDKRTMISVIRLSTYKEGIGSYSGGFNTYEDAELGCLKQLIKLVNEEYI